MAGIGTVPIYRNNLGQAIFWIDGAPCGNRSEADVLLLVLHHTEGTDSRGWLGGNAPKPVSATYLVGAYPDTQNLPRIYKYMSEREKVPYTQGLGSLGGLPHNPNLHAISIEVEGPPFDERVLAAAATLAASIVIDWHNARNRNLLIIGHDHLDDWDRKGRHTDPHWDWSDFLADVYIQMYGGPAQLTGHVAGWRP